MTSPRVARALARHAGRAAAGAVPLLLLAAWPAAAQLTLRLTSVPAGTPADAEIHVAGSFNGWNPGDAAFRLTVRDGAHVLTLPDSVRGRIEFKLTLGSWERVETDAAGGDIDNRVFRVPEVGAVMHEVAVARWRDPARPAASTRTSSVSVLDEAFEVPQLGRERRVWIYLPPDYATSRRRYPVLYMHDGQNVFDAATSYAGEWGVDEALDSLHAAGARAAIVVAVDHGGDRRFDEYNPWPDPRGRGGEGAAYVDFLVHTLKPHIDRTFRTLPDRRNTAVAGSSMGGFISLYAVLRYPEVFGSAGVFSPALWVADGIWEMARDAPRPEGGPRIYMVTGAREGDQPERWIFVHDRMVDLLRARGFVPGTHLQAHVREDGTHTEAFWRREFPEAYRWIFGGTRRP